jgi:hypothetical protein
MACLTPKRIFILKTNSLSQASVSEKDLASLSTPEHITLLLKNHKQTVLLSVIPTTPFNEIKSLLLAVLKSRNITSLDGIPISDEAEDIEFGVLRNKKNPVEGWVPLNIKEMEVGDAKGNKRKVGGKKSVLNESPAGASLVDGSMLAFRFRTESKRDAPEDEDDEMEIEDDPGGNVILPSYDDEE